MAPAISFSAVQIPLSTIWHIAKGEQEKNNLSEHQPLRPRVED